MKTILAIVTVILFVSCNSNDSNIKYSYSYNSEGEIKREMVLKNALNDIEIQMEGNATFNTEGTTITTLTPGGSINYRNKKTEVRVTPAKNGVTVLIEENGNILSNTSDTGKEIITEVIRNVKKLQQKQK
ncbi:hypothetical protein ACX0HA_07730 [Flavobacterium hauense]